MLYKIDQNIANHIDRRVTEKLVNEYGKRPAKLIAEDVGLTTKEIYVIAYRLGLTEHVGYIRHRAKPFTEDEKRYFIANYGRMRTDEVAKKLHTTKNYLWQLAFKLGLTRSCSKGKEN